MSSTRARLAALRPRGGRATLSFAAGGVLALELCVATWLLVSHQAAVLGFPYPLDYGEGPLLDHVLRLASGQNPYPADLATSPFHIGVYPPVFPALQVPLFWLFGPALWYGRLLSVLGMLAAALSCGLILRALTRDAVAAAVGGALLLASPYVVYWSPLARVDSLALGLSLMGLCVVVCGRGRRRELVLASLLFVAASYTRQSAALAAPFASFVWLLHERGTRPAFELATFTVAIGGSLLLGLVVATSGGFWSNVFAAHDVLFQWSMVLYFARETLLLMPLLVACVVAYGVFGIWHRDRAWWAIAPFAFTGLTVALSVGKFGSNLNYLLEPVAGFGLVAGALVASLRARPVLRAILSLCLAVQVHFLVEGSRDDYGQREMWKLEAREDIARLAELVGSSSGPVVADEFMALIPLAGRQLVFQPFAFSELARAGSWDETPVLESLRRGEFALLLLYQAPDWPTIQTRWSPAMIAAIEEYYFLEEEIAHTLVARPGLRTRQ